MPRDTDTTAPQPVDLAQEADFSIGPLGVRPSICEIVFGTQTVTLQPRVLKVLVVLARVGGKVVSREELLARCWPGVVVGDDAIGRCIGRLRRLSEVEFPSVFSIVTQPRVGYRLVTKTSDEDHASEPSTALDAGSQESQQESKRVGRPISLRFPLLAGALAVSLILCLAIAIAVVTHPPASPYRIAVRDFKVQGAGADRGEALADRVAAAVNDRQLPVVARSRSRRGDFDKARYIVGGDVRRVGDSLVVDVNLDDAGSGLVLWNATVARPLSESEALNDEVAEKIADLISLVQRFLGPGGNKATPEAVAALFKASEIMRGGGDTRLETREAFRRFRDLAPKFSKAHSAFAMATARSLNTQPADVAAQWRRQALSEAHQAIVLDPKNGEGYTAIGILTPATDYAQRETWFSKGLSVDPDDPSLSNFLGNLLLDVGRAKEALPWLQRSLTLDPLSPPKTASVIYALSGAGRFADAQTLIDKAERLWPRDSSTGQAILWTSLIYADPAQALAVLGRFQSRRHPLPADEAAAWAAFEKARGGALSQAKAQELLAATMSKAEDLNTLTDAFSLLGDKDDAFRAIEIGRAQHRFQPSVLYELATASLRRDLRFMPAASSFGLVSYWTQTGHWPDFCRNEAKPLGCPMPSKTGGLANG